MNKNERHVKAEEFRKQISWPTQRAEAIRTLIAKTDYDESDEMRIRELFRKTDSASGCEEEYKQLICHLYQLPKYQPVARDFYKRWTCK